MKKPVIIVIVYRRYQELLRNLQIIRERARLEFDVEPPIVLVWSEPKLAHWHILEKLDALVLSREAEPGEKGQSISYHCARDIYCGLSFVKENFGDDYYAVVHCCDCAPRDFILSRIHDEMQYRDAFIVRLPNTVTSRDVWHTNFFAVSMNESYWPPVIGRNHPDILERCWGNSLKSAGATNYSFDGNANFRTFTHLHENENFNSYELQRVIQRSSLLCFTKGTASWRKFLLNMIPTPVKQWLCSMEKSLRTLWRRYAIKMIIPGISLYLWYVIEKTRNEKWHLQNESPRPIN